MAKKMKRKTLVGLLIGASVVATVGVLGVIEGTTGNISKVFQEENICNGSYELTSINSKLTAEMTEDSTLSQKIDYSSESGPFKKAVVNMNLYGDEGGFEVTEQNQYYFVNVSKLEIKLTLKDDVDFYVNHLLTQIKFSDNEDQDQLNLTVKVGMNVFNTYNLGTGYYISAYDNAFSNDITLTITNDKAKEKEDSKFQISRLSFNNNSSSAWTA